MAGIARNGRKNRPGVAMRKFLGSMSIRFVTDLGANIHILFIENSNLTCRLGFAIFSRSINVPAELLITF